MSYTVIDNKEEKRFEIHQDGFVAFEDYKLFDGGISYLHTEVPKDLEGKGIASALAKYILDYAIENNLKVKPYCPYIKAYIDKHGEYQFNSVFHNPELAHLK
jgi:predicted GNAT family acetyltransferase